MAASAALGLGLIAPPEVPADRVAYLRDVLRKTVTDPAFVAEAKERKIPINFADGERWQQIVVTAAAAAPEPVRHCFFNLTQQPQQR